MDLKDYLRILRRRLWYFAGFVLFILIMYAGWISWEPETWTSDAIVTVRDIDRRNQMMQTLSGAHYLRRQIWQSIFWMQRTRRLEYVSALLLYQTIHQEGRDVGRHDLNAPVV